MVAGRRICLLNALRICDLMTDVLPDMLELKWQRGSSVIARITELQHFPSEEEESYGRDRGIVPTFWD